MLYYEFDKERNEHCFLYAEQFDKETSKHSHSFRWKTIPAGEDIQQLVDWINRIPLQLRLKPVQKSLESGSYPYSQVGE